MGYGHVSEEKSEYRLHIRHIHSTHHSRYRDESDSGDRGANHSKRDYIPR